MSRSILNPRMVFRTLTSGPKWPTTPISPSARRNGGRAHRLHRAVDLVEPDPVVALEEGIIERGPSRGLCNVPRHIAIGRNGQGGYASSDLTTLQGFPRDAPGGRFLVTSEPASTILARRFACGGVEGRTACSSAMKWLLSRPRHRARVLPPPGQAIGARRCSHLQAKSVSC